MAPKENIYSAPQSIFDIIQNTVFNEVGLDDNGNADDNDEVIEGYMDQVEPLTDDEDVSISIEEEMEELQIESDVESEILSIYEQIGGLEEMTFENLEITPRSTTVFEGTFFVPRRLFPLSSDESSDESD